MIEAILPPEAAAAEAFEDSPAATIFPEEAALVARAAEVRRREFTTGRDCAHRALSALGAPVGPVLSGPCGAPAWPPGVVGSITHCAGYRAGVVAREGEVRSLGIDAEPNAPLPPGAEPVIALPEEARRLRELDRALPWVHWGRLLFSAKEAVYKAWFPLGGRMLSFEHATVTFAVPAGAISGTFTGRVHATAAPGRGAAPTLVPGRWLAAGGLLLTSVVLPAPRTVPGAPRLRRSVPAPTPAPRRQPA
ncbi:4'-phosphopantetheinyl transferase [Streptomyces sp. NPDC058000]|uniref:4'-phosphopantetheinyl transferase family protein n=1 Tax=Streptomyces sp. NPDC058000 TaxID=3346299 RepID=UPI0036E7957E